SEYVAPADKRRQYISGFSGSAGTAVITQDKQAVWSDGRYFLQAEDELDCNWLLMKEGEPDVPTILEWLKLELTSGMNISADSTLIGSSEWLNYIKELGDINMIEIDENLNLVDEVWGNDNVTSRPPYAEDEVFIHDVTYAGRSWEEKVDDVRAEMLAQDADLIILTALDEIAWLFNLRGNDIPYNPVFRSYVTISANESNLFISPNKVTDAVRIHLKDVNIFDYDNFLSHLDSIQANKVMIPNAYSYAGGASYAVYSRIVEEARFLVTSPVLLMKAMKNPTEIQGMRNAHIKDAVALCDFLCFMEKEIKAGNDWTEISAANKLADYRGEQDGEKGLSFTTISGFGSNGAIIHYKPTSATDKTIDTSSLYLLDSGGQYLDGTTDVTRTMHYGTPTSLMVETYTRVLMGQIDLAMAVFPDGTMDTRTDILARGPLYEIGLDYNHGTGHGIGMFLSVHEAPTQVRIYGVEDHPFRYGYFFSDGKKLYLLE
ncbi:Xaa-Pro aminopeptidase 2, partial [Halocaridina rubra]